MRRKTLIKKFITSNSYDIPNYTVKNFKKKKYNYALVIPILNENGRISEQLEKIKALSPKVDIILADGGSTDNSIINSKLKFANVSKLLEIKSEGQLSAQLRMAFHYCLFAGYHGVITMDGNNKDGVLGINEILGKLEEGFDYVQGSRFIKNGQSINTPTLRYIAIRFVHAPLTSLGAKYWFTDTTNGFRGYSRDLLESDLISIFRHVFQKYELIFYIPIAASKYGFRVTEVPVKREYPKNVQTPTKIMGIISHFLLINVLFKSVLGVYDHKEKT